MKPAMGVAPLFYCLHFEFYLPSHSLTNKQLFNFGENPRPELVFIGVNYVTFVSGYDPSANLSVWCFVGDDSTQFCPYATYK